MEVFVIPKPMIKLKTNDSSWLMSQLRSIVIRWRHEMSRIVLTVRNNLVSVWADDKDREFPMNDFMNESSINLFW